MCNLFKHTVNVKFYLLLGLLILFMNFTDHAATQISTKLLRTWIQLKKYSRYLALCLSPKLFLRSPQVTTNSYIILTSLFSFLYWFLCISHFVPFLMYLIRQQQTPLMTYCQWGEKKKKKLGPRVIQTKLVVKLGQQNITVYLLYSWFLVGF